MKPKKLTQQHAEQTSARQEEATESAAEQTFATPEELLRHDAASNPPPESVARQLGESVAGEPARTPWWKRMFQGK